MRLETQGKWHTDFGYSDQSVGICFESFCTAWAGVMMWRGPGGMHGNEEVEEEAHMTAGTVDCDHAHPNPSLLSAACCYLAIYTHAIHASKHGS